MAISKTDAGSGEHPARAGMSPWRSEPGGRGPRLETKVAFRYVPGMAHTGRPRLGLRVMTPAEQVRRHRAKRARDTAALPLNQIVCGHAAEVMAGWLLRCRFLLILLFYAQILIFLSKYFISSFSRATFLSDSINCLFNNSISSFRPAKVSLASTSFTSVSLNRTSSLP